jgi:hypothetical protein
MSLIRAVISSVIGALILRFEGGPIYYIVTALPLSDSLQRAGFWVILGLVVGLISGSSIWGAASSIGVFPFLYIVYPFLFGGTVHSSEYVYNIIERIGVEYIIYLLIGAFIGGYIYKRLSGEDEYIVLRVRNS